MERCRVWNVCGFEGTQNKIILDSSMVEHTAVNRGVVGSSPTRGANIKRHRLLPMSFLLYQIALIKKSPHVAERISYRTKKESLFNDSFDIYSIIFMLN